MTEKLLTGTLNLNINKHSLRKICILHGPVFVIATTSMSSGLLISCLKPNSTAKVTWRRDFGFKSPSKDWSNPVSNPCPRGLITILYATCAIFQLPIDGMHVSYAWIFTLILICKTRSQHLHKITTDHSSRKHVRVIYTPLNPTFI